MALEELLAAVPDHYERLWATDTPTKNAVGCFVEKCRKTAMPYVLYVNGVLKAKIEEKRLAYKEYNDLVARCYKGT